jgi:hypothetical protein
MRTKFKKYIVISLIVLLMAGVSFTGWTITTAKSVHSQQTLNNESQSANMVPRAPNHSNTILLLVGTGLVGLIGIRRQGKALESSAKVKQPKHTRQKSFLPGRP